MKYYIFLSVSLTNLGPIVSYAIQPHPGDDDESSFVSITFKGVVNRWTLNDCSAEMW